MVLSVRPRHAFRVHLSRVLFGIISFNFCGCHFAASLLHRTLYRQSPRISLPFFLIHLALFCLFLPLLRTLTCLLLLCAYLFIINCSQSRDTLLSLRKKGKNESNYWFWAAKETKNWWPLRKFFFASKVTGFWMSVWSDLARLKCYLRLYSSIQVVLGEWRSCVKWQ